MEMEVDDVGGWLVRSASKRPGSDMPTPPEKKLNLGQRGEPQRFVLQPMEEVHEAAVQHREPIEPIRSPPLVGVAALPGAVAPSAVQATCALDVAMVATSDPEQVEEDPLVGRMWGECE